MTEAIRIPAGSTEYVGMTVNGPDGVDLTDDVIEVAVVASTATPGVSDWGPPSLLTFPSQNVIKASLLVGPAAGRLLGQGVYRLWMKVADTPEVPWVSSPDVFRIV